jgi:hypothetical protein
MHPTHRKLRDGWGTRTFVSGGGEQATTEADPPPSAKDDNQNTNTNTNTTATATTTAKV